MAKQCFVALGGNLGNVLATFRTTIAAMPRVGVRVLQVSSAYRNEALLPNDIEGPAPDYWNAVCRVETRLAAEVLLDVLLQLETRAGRVRLRRWAPRTLDLDILTYGDAVIDVPRLRVPHPEIAQRAFVLQPLAELAPELVLPPRGVSVAELLRHHPDPMGGIKEIREQWLSGWSDVGCVRVPTRLPMRRGTGPTAEAPRPRYSR